MTEDEFAAWRAEWVESFSHDLSDAMDLRLDAARARAVPSSKNFLPTVSSRQVHIWLIVESGRAGRCSSLQFCQHQGEFVDDLAGEESQPTHTRGQSVTGR